MALTWTLADSDISSAKHLFNIILDLVNQPVFHSVSYHLHVKQMFLLYSCSGGQLGLLLL